VTIESPDLDFVYSDSDQYDAEIAGSLYIHIVVSIDTVLSQNVVLSVRQIFSFFFFYLPVDAI